MGPEPRAAKLHLPSLLSMPTQRGTLFLNPRSGSAAAEIDDVRSFAKEHAIEVIDVEPSIPMGDLVRERLDRGVRLFIAGGGDGTVHHLLQHLVHTEGILAILPLGTFNHSAKDLGAPPDWRGAFELALSDSVQQIDAGRVNDHWFLNSVMLGIYPAVATYRERFRKSHGKWKAYWKSIRIAMKNFPHVSITVESAQRMEVVKTQLFSVAVNRYDLSKIGVIAPKVALDEGKLTAYWLPYLDKIRFAHAISLYLRGRVSEVEGFRWMHTTSLKVQSGRTHLRVGIDGELYDLQPPFHITVHPASLLVKSSRSDD
jgi:diacylglycerol kinase family enzyme